MIAASARLARLDAAVTHEDSVDRIAAGHVLDGRIILEEAPDLTGSPDIALVRAVLAKLDDPLHDVIGCTMRTRSRTV